MKSIIFFLVLAIVTGILWQKSIEPGLSGTLFFLFSGLVIISFVIWLCDIGKWNPDGDV